MPFLAEFTAEEFVALALGGRTEVVVNIDWGNMVPLISHEFERLRGREINDAFQALWITWGDAQSYQQPDLRRQKFLEASSRGADMLAKLQSSVREQMKSLYKIPDEEPAAYLDLCSQYLTALMCCIQAKRELESESFSRSTTFLEYAEWMERQLLDTYALSMGIRNGQIDAASHLYALALDEDPEIGIYVDSLKDFLPAGFDPRLSFLARNLDFRSQWEITIDVRLSRASAHHAGLALKLRELARWASALRKLIVALSTPVGETQISLPNRSDP